MAALGAAALRALRVDVATFRLGTELRRPSRHAWLTSLTLCLACGGRTALEGGTGSASGSSGAGGATSGAPSRGGGPSSGGSLGNSAGGASMAAAAGLASGGAVTQVLSAPDPRSTPPVACANDGWCGSLGDYVAIWGSSLSDIWVAANNVKNDNPNDMASSESSVLLHWDGGQWTTSELPKPEPVRLTALWGSSARDVWVAGTPAYVAHYDGTSWSRSYIPTGTPTEVDALGGTGPTDVWAAGYGMFHFDGMTWTPRDTGGWFPISSVSGAGHELWNVSGGIARHSADAGKSWSPPPPELTPASPPLPYTWRAVWSPRAGAAFIAGQAGALGHWSNGDWGVQTIAHDGDSRNFNAVAGLSTEDVWAVGDRGALAHWNGAAWLPATSLTDEALRGVWGNSGTYFAVGDHGTFLKLEPAGWVSSVVSTNDVKAIWGGAPTDVWAVGKVSIHWDGASWTPVEQLRDLELTGVWGSQPRDVWAVGKLGRLEHFDGARWETFGAPTPSDLTGVWGSTARDVWAVSALGEFLHFDGKSWTLWPAEDFGPLAAVHGNNASDVVAVGSMSRVHFDGKTWTRLPPHPLHIPMYLTAFGDGEHVYVGGQVNWSAYKAGGANPELGRWDGRTLLDSLQPTWSGDATVQAGWAGAPTDVWIALPMLAHSDGRSWTKGAISNVSVSALGATTQDLWGAATTGHMLRKRLH